MLVYYTKLAMIYGPSALIYNEIHSPTWLLNEMAQAWLPDDHLPADWRDRHDEPEVWRKVLEIPDNELWAARNALRTYLFNFIRERARLRWRDRTSQRRASGRAAGTLLDPNALTIGFHAALHRLQVASS